jgi:hypothetical protein
MKAGWAEVAPRIVATPLYLHAVSRGSWYQVCRSNLEFGLEPYSWYRVYNIRLGRGASPTGPTSELPCELEKLRDRPP